jgi:taurine dioxygenase
MTTTKTYSDAADKAQKLHNARKAGVYDTIQVKAVEPVIGVEVSGADLTKPLSSEQFDDLLHALANHNVLFFHDQPILTPKQQVAFAKRFGDLHAHPAAPTLEGHPEIFVIHTHKGSQVNNGEKWHSDVSCDEEPPLGTILQLHKTPSAGGDTLFANMYAAFDTLSDTMKDILRGLSALHESEHIYRGRYSDRGVDDHNKAYPEAIHPIVRTHPVSGREALFVNGAFTTQIVGMSKPEGDAILSYLFNHVEQPQFQVRFRWSPGSIAFWDNRCTQHLALWDYWPEERKGHRITIKGERPV